MRFIRLRTLLGAFALTIAAGIAFVAPAQAWGTFGYCDNAGVLDATHSPKMSNFFIGHAVVARAHACIAPDNVSAGLGRRLVYHATPTISLPSTSPLGGGESVTVTQAPFFYRAVRGGVGNVVVKVEYRFSVRQCVVTKPLCNTFLFQLNSSTMQTWLCVVGGANPCGDPITW